MGRTNVISRRAARSDSFTHGLALRGNTARRCVDSCTTCETRYGAANRESTANFLIEVRDVDVDGNCVLIGFIDAQTITPDFGNGDERHDEEDDDDDDEEDGATN
ncbi:MAG TPA: hypothetical protein VIJ86_02320 [Acidimicrobiales bacterium]